MTACRWFRAGLLSVPARRVGWLILVDQPMGKVGVLGCTAVYARVPSADQKSRCGQVPVDKVVTEVGSALNGHRRRCLALLGDPWVRQIVVEHRDWFCRWGSEYVEAALAAQGGELVVIDSAEVDDGLVGDMTEILTSLCPRLYGERSAQNRAQRALAGAAEESQAR